MAYFENNRHHLVSSVIPPPSQSKLPKNRGSNLGGKEIRLVEAVAATLEEEIKEHKDKSDRSKSDRHWKRPLKKTKVSDDDLDGKGSSALGVPDVSPLSPLNAHFKGLIELGSDESLMGPYAVDSTIEEVGTSKTPASKPVKQSLRPSTLLEEIRRGKVTVGGKYIGSRPSKGDVCPKEPLQKERAMQLSLQKKELERRLQSIIVESEQLSILSYKKVEAIDQQELQVAKFQDEVNTLESTLTIAEEAIEVLAMVRRSMEVA
ncbi:hypothetical protein E5676_scaffold186G001530 [Cucumis melo var. makuwa]|uniref:Uncharacterized protein n=2 Tax=Cucumis melo TaxID=3656 RepID=A0A5D3CRJ3_CUCMM|nr:hypothetical protein E6C27_scaffold1184G00090 [Cucumis melo var. makuwa]TYK14483.1 hypothetical protein E5676_scaffold186G001530 [Cucumis melo var. makuwa]